MENVQILTQPITLDFNNIQLTMKQVIPGNKTIYKGTMDYPGLKSRGPCTISATQLAKLRSSQV